jgi:hypothetical protein
MKMIVVSRCARMSSLSNADREDASFRDVRKPSSPWSRAAEDHMTACLAAELEA